MTKTRFPVILVLTSAGVFPALGSPAPIPSGLANATDWVQFSYPSSFPGNQQNIYGGGAYLPTISQLNTLGTGPLAGGLSQLTTAFCVDYQLTAPFNAGYVADVETLNNITGPPNSNVQYGNITTNGGPSNSWTYFLAAPSSPVDGTTNSNSAAYRYTLAAALVSQYVDMSGTIDPTQVYFPTPSPEGYQNLAIQEAIWYLTSNDTTGTSSPFPFSPSPYTPGDPNKDDYSYWVNYVLNNTNNVVSNVNLSGWAVVSGPATVTGAIEGPQDGDYQTLLVQVGSPVPEPTFYGVLAIGLVGLFAAARRRCQ